MRNKSDYLSRILTLEADAANKWAEASKLKKEVIKQFCPYKEGQFLRIRRQISPDQMVKISFIRYEPGESGTIDQQWGIKVQPWLKDGSRPCVGRSNFWLRPEMDFETVGEEQEVA